MEHDHFVIHRAIIQYIGTKQYPPTSLSVERVYEATYQEVTNHHSQIRHHVIGTVHHSQIGQQSAIQISNIAKCENSLF